MSLHTKLTSKKIIAFVAMFSLYLQMVAPFLSPLPLAQADFPGNFPDAEVVFRSNQITTVPTGMQRDSMGRLIIEDEMSSPARVLIYPSLPTGPSDDPLYILGPSGLPFQNSLFAFSNGTRLVIVDEYNHRVLLYNTIPTTSGFANPDVVLGQPNFTTSNSGTSQNEFSQPSGVVLIGNRLVVADGLNNRLMIWNDVTTLTNNQAADLVLGQPDFVSSGAGVAAGEFDRPGYLSTDGTSLTVTDQTNNRVLVYSTLPVVSGVIAPDFTVADTGAPDFSPLSNPRGAHFDGNVLSIADGSNNRVLLYTGGLADLDADFVVGQPDFTSTGTGVNPDQLSQPYDAFMSGTDLFVADKNNARVTRYLDPINTDLVADNAYGAYDFTGAEVLNANRTTQNNGRDVAFSDRTLIGNVSGTLADSGAVYLYDGGAGRILKYNSTPGSDHASADLFLGSDASSFSGKSTQQTPTQTSLKFVAPLDSSTPTPFFMDSDGTVVAVADKEAHRVLLWSTEPTTNNEPFDVVLGQTNFTDDFSGTSDTQLSSPTDVAIDGNTFAISDTNNNRVVIWTSGVPNVSNDAAEFVVGQVDFTSNSSGNTRYLFSNPKGIDVVGDKLFVADTGNNRILIFDLDDLAAPMPVNGYEAIRVLGQSNFTNTGSSNAAAGLNSPSDVAFDGTYIYVSDTNNHRISVWEGIPAYNGKPADFVIGRPSFTGTIPDELSRKGTNTPLGIDVKNNKLLVGGGLEVSQYRSNDFEHSAKIFDLTNLSADTTAPYITAASPVDDPNFNGLRVNPSTNLSYTFTDTSSNVDRLSLNVTIDAVPAIVSGVCQAGYSCTGLGGANSQTWSFSVNPDVDLNPGSNVQVDITIADDAVVPNTFTGSLYFQTNNPPSQPSNMYINASTNTAQTGVAAFTAPVIDSTSVAFSAEYSDGDGDPATHYRLQVTDPLDVTFAAPVFDSGKLAFASSLASGQRSVDMLATGLADSTSYIVRVCFWDNVYFPNATLNDACSSPENFSIDTSSDVSPPYLQSAFPAHGEVDVPLSPTFAYTIEDDGVGVDQAQVNIDVDGVLIVSSGVCQPGIGYDTCSVTPSGSSVVVSFEKDVPFGNLENHTVYINACDLSANCADRYLQFATVQAAPMGVAVTLDNDVASAMTTYHFELTPDPAKPVEDNHNIVLQFPAGVDLSAIVPSQITVQTTNVDTPGYVTVDVLNRTLTINMQFVTDDSAGDPIFIDVGLNTVGNPPTAGLKNLGVQIFQNQNLPMQHGTGTFTITGGGPDTTRPTVSAATPANAATNVAISPSFSYTLTDNVAVDVSTVQITVNDPVSGLVTAISGTTCQAGFTCTTIPGGDGASVTYAFTSNTAYDFDDVVVVSLTANDTSGNPLDPDPTTRSFSIRAKAAVSAPTLLFSDNTSAQTGTTNPTNLDTTGIVFSAVHQDADGVAANRYRLEIATSNTFGPATIYDSGAGGTVIASIPAGSRSGNLAVPTTFDAGMTYYWRVQFWNATYEGAGTNSAIAQFGTQATAAVVSSSLGGGGGFTPGFVPGQALLDALFTPNTPGTQDEVTRPSAPDTTSARPPVTAPIADTCAYFESLASSKDIAYADLASDGTLDDYATFLLENGIILGKTPTEFGPKDVMTRAEVLRSLVQARCDKFTIRPVAEKPFPDVSVNHPDALYIDAAKRAQIVSGYKEDGTYRPDRFITRAESLKVVVQEVLGGEIRTFDGPYNPFVDVGETEWYVNYVRFAVAAGLLSVPENKQFYPNEPMSREEITRLLAKTLQSRQKVLERLEEVIQEGATPEEIAAALGEENRGAEEGKIETPLRPAPTVAEDDIVREPVQACVYFDARKTTHTYTDIENSALNNFAEQLLAYGVVIGKEQNEFAPRDEITRSEILRIMMQANCEDFVLMPVTTPPFPDVPTNHRDAAFIAAAKQANIIRGYGDGSFKPDHTISHAEILKVLLETALGKVIAEFDSTLALPYGDVESSAWYARYVRFAAFHDLAVSVDGANFKPNSNGNRGFIAETLLRILQLRDGLVGQR